MRDRRLMRCASLSACSRMWTQASSRWLSSIWPIAQAWGQASMVTSVISTEQALGWLAARLSITEDHQWKHAGRVW